MHCIKNKLTILHHHIHSEENISKFIYRKRQHKKPTRFWKRLDKINEHIE
jgi:hypothetical protein